MKRKKDFDKFTKRNVHKRRKKEEMRRELLRAINEVGVSYDGVKIKNIENYGAKNNRSASHRKDERSLRGIFIGSKSDFAFVTPEGGGEDIFIPPMNKGGAIDGDFVEILYHLYKNHEGEEKSEGRVVKILEFGRRTVIGTVEEEIWRHGRRVVRQLYVRPDDAKIFLKPRVRDSFDARVGDKVEALIRRDGSSSPECDIVRIFGDTESKEANYEAILADAGIITEFTKEELALANEVAKEQIVTTNRTDRRDEVIFTIDGAGAKDLDDAISLRKLPGGKWRLGVHIADVSHYVRERTPLDRCVMARGTSVYFTDKVVPMLPESLSNGACSLNAGEDKYALSAIIDLDSDGSIIKTKLENSVIRSQVRGVYSEINALLDEDCTGEIKKKYAKIKPTLLKMRELYEILLQKSKKRGAIDFDSDEAEILLDSLGNPIEITKRERGVSERIIEQFMLTANEAVAGLLRSKNLPCVYRIHEAPLKEDFDAFLGYLESLGFDTRKIGKEPTGRELQKILSDAEAKGLFKPVSYTMLRAMTKAKYSEIHSSHFGLGIENYCHFTSPIRRLSDLATHRIIKNILLSDKRPESFTSYARRAAAAATEGELRAISAERRIENLYKVIYMSEHIGEIFDAEISSVTSFGLFCMPENTCEGLVPISELPGVYIFDERNLTLRSSNKVYHVADKVKVKLEEANITRGNLRFSIVNSEDFTGKNGNVANYSLQKTYKARKR